MPTCPRCQQLNPDEAAFCWFDGMNLRLGAEPAAVLPAASLGPPRLPHEFVFASGRRCLTYDELVAGCLAEWPIAAELLGQRAFQQFFIAAGRLDLARLADEASAQQGDPDLALDAWLTRLPALQPPQPQLELAPEHLPLGELQTGGKRQVELTVRNVGSGLLHGTLTIAAGASWLRLLGASTDGPVPLKVADTLVLRFEVDTAGVVPPQKCAARLAFLTNGGLAEVWVRVDVTALPFPAPPYQGARSPRQLAVLMRAQPRPAIELLQQGDVARWFAGNCWQYPVVGPAAPGMAAVQQFFEALGLARPPRLRLANPAAQFEATAGEVLHGQVQVLGDERKWLHARAESTVPWLRVTTPHVGGPQQLRLDYEVETAALPVGAHATVLRLTANGGQVLTLPVRVAILPPVTPPCQPGRWIGRGALLGLLLRLGLAGPADLFARVLALEPGAAAGTVASWSEAPLGPEFVRHFVLATWWLGALAGAVLMLRRSGPRDLPAGLLAGAGAGAAGAAAVACALPWLDGPARLLWQRLPALPALQDSRWLATLAWLLLATAVWTAGGALLGSLHALFVSIHSSGRRRPAAAFPK